MSGAGGITGNININTTGQAEATKLLDVLKQYVPTLNALLPILAQLDTIEAKNAASISRTLTVYQKAANLATSWANATVKATAAEKASGDAAAVLTNALDKVGAALDNVTGMSKREYDTKSREITLSKQLADISLAEANAIGVLAKAELDLAKAQTEAAKTKNLVNGAPLSAYQAAVLAQREQAAAAKQAADASNQADAAARKQAQSDAQVAAAAEKAAAAERQRAEATAAGTAATDANTASIKGSYFALYQVAVAYAAVAKASETFVTAPISAAASYEQAFNQVIRSTELLGDTSTEAVGKTALLKTQLEGLATTIPASFESLSGIAALGAQLGIPEANVKSFTQTVAQFAAVTNVSADQAATAFGRITNLLGVPASQYQQLASAVAELGVSSAATESEVLNVTQSIAAAAHGAGLGTEDVLGLSTALASMKVPQYLARGTITRLFADISRAEADGTKGMKPFADTMGITADEALKLAKSDPSTFFTDLIKGIGNATSQGANLTTILDNLGIKNASDVTVVQRLAGNYNLLANSLQQAHLAFNEPVNDNYLTKASDLVFSSLTNKITEFGNSFKNVLANSGTYALAPLEAIVSTLTSLLNAFNSLPPAVTAGFGVLAAGLAIWAAYKAAMATFIAGTLAFKAALGGLSASSASSAISFGTLRQAFNETFRGAAQVVEGNQAIILSNEEVVASVEAEIGALTQLQAAEAKAAAAVAGTAGSNIFVVSSAGEATVATEAETAAMISLAAGADTAKVATTGLSTAMKGNLIFAGITALLAVGTAIFASLGKSTKAAEDSAAAQQKLSDAFVAAAGGADALNAAIAKDTAAGAANGFSELHRTITDLHDGTAKVSDDWYRLDAQGNIIKNTAQNVASGVYQYADSTLKASSAQDELNKKAGLTNDQLKRQDIILGEATAAATRQALLTQVVGNAQGQGGILNPADIQDAEQHGLQIGQALTDGITKGSSTMVAEVDKFLKVLDQRFGTEQAKLDALTQIVPGTQSTLGTPSQITAQQKVVDGITAEIDRYKELTATQQAGMTTLQEIIQTGSVYGEGLQDLTQDTMDGTEANDGMTASIVGLNGAGITATQVFDTLSSRFSDLMTQAFQLSDAVGAVQDATEKLGAGLVDNGKEFTSYTEGGRANLANLETAVNAVAQENANLVKSGQETAQQATENVAKFVSDTVNSLATQGVDTSQLDFLVNYVNQLKANPAIWTITTDTSGAIIGINDMAAAAVNAGNTVNGVVMSVTQQIAAAQAAIDNFQLPSGYGETPGAAGNNPPTSVPGFTLPTPTTSSTPQSSAAAIQAGKDQAQFAKDAADAKAADEAAAQAASDQASAQRAAGTAAKQSAKDSTDAEQAKQDAIDLTNEKIQKQQQYITDVGSFWAQEGTAATASATGVGNVAEALTKLGTSIATNGTSFDQFSEGGRSNLDALTSALNAYGGTLQTQLTNGTITVDQAQTAFQQFAGQTRSDLLAAGVPLSQINSYFQSIGVNGNMTTTNASIRQFSGLVQDGAKDVTAMGDAADAANKKAGESAQELADYYKAVDAYFKGVTDNAFSFINAEGAVFAGLQNLGASIVENGTSFNTLTDSGRKNFAALGTVVSAFETDMQQRVDAGIITAKQGAAELASFSGGVYNELRQLGVKAADILPIMRSLGLSTSGFNTSDRAVSQYAGTLTNSAAAARAAASATSALGTALKEASDYADLLSSALDASFEQFNGLAQATDATTSAQQAMSQVLTDNIQKVKDLTKSNADLKAGIATDQADITNYNKQIALALKYGQTDKAADLTAKRDASQADLADKQGQVVDNQKQIDEINKYGTALTGNSKEAIANRASVLGLQKTMFDQIDAYAKTGASTKQVAAYTKDLQKQFDAAGRQAGYSEKDLAKYTGQFTTYVSKVNATPKSLVTKVSADVTAANAALDALPTHSSFHTTAYADTATARAALGAIPTRSTFTATARAAGVTAVVNTLNHIPKAGAYTVTPKVSRTTAANAIRGAGLNGGTYAVTPKATGLAAMKNQIAGAMKDTSIVFQRASAAVLGVLGISVGANGVSTPRLTTQHVVGPAAPVPIPGTNPPQYRTSAGTILWNKGGLVGANDGSVRGFAEGGRIPGVPPADSGLDNLVAQGPHGLIKVRSNEWIIREPAVKYYGNPMMSAINNMTYPKVGFNGGGSTGGGAGYSSPGEVRLSYADRKLLMQVVGRPVVAAIDGQRLDKVTANRQAAAVRAGAN